MGRNEEEEESESEESNEEDESLEDDEEHHYRYSRSSSCYGCCPSHVLLLEVVLENNCRSLHHKIESCHAILLLPPWLPPAFVQNVTLERLTIGIDL